MALLGAVPPEAEAAFELVAWLAGLHLEVLATRRADRARQRLEAALVHPSMAPERAALQALSELMDLTGAAAGVLALSCGGQTRRLAAVGVRGPDLPPLTREARFAADQFLCPLPLGPDLAAVLELRPPAGGEFTPEAAVATRACLAPLQTWLRAAAPSLTEVGVAEGENRSGFEVRIQEELERARRFDLRLALILVEVDGPAPLVGALKEALRRELRGSDVLGSISSRRVAALLTHTDPEGLGNVVRRLRRTLVTVSDTLRVPGISLGQAVFTPGCPTADALVSEALRQAEPVSAAVN
jgi:GGDEF domain-containing protein